MEGHRDREHCDHMSEGGKDLEGSGWRSEVQGGSWSHRIRYPVCYTDTSMGCD